VRSFHDLIVWQKAVALCTKVYRTTDAFPGHERFGMTAELRKTARSIAYNVAEGHRRSSAVDYARFLSIAAGSSGELETQFVIARALGYLDETSSTKLTSDLTEIARMLAALRRRLRPQSPSGPGRLTPNP
jgi:four helix bundle protein